MNKREVIEQFCKIQRQAQKHIGFDYAADCFCHESEGRNPNNYQNDCAALLFIKDAVSEKIQAEIQTGPGG